MTVIKELKVVWLDVHKYEDVHESRDTHIMSPVKGFSSYWPIIFRVNVLSSESNDESQMAKVYVSLLEIIIFCDAII